MNESARSSFQSFANILNAPPMNFDFLFNLFSLFGEIEFSTILILLCISMVGGAVRGFAGFGAGLIIMPVASAIIDPKIAVATFLAVDFFVALPLVPSAMKKCDWPTVTPTAIAAFVAIPSGTYVLIHTDPLILRWCISGAIILMLGLLISGWRYQGRPRLPISVGVGGIAGFLSGTAQIPGPPVVTYWMSGPFAVATIRANLITFFFLESISGFIVYIYSGLFTHKVLILIAILAPIYATALWIGASLHSSASEKSYRTVAYVLIAIAALTSLPILDWLLRGG
jgi:uncharacterized membrane protein YfcA